MSLSYATAVPVFVVAALLNFFFLSSPIYSLHCGQDFESCEECLKSPCHTDPESPRPCTLKSNNATFTCFTCSPQDKDGNSQYYYQDECEANCEDKSKCVCDGSCVVCAMSSPADNAVPTCDFPKIQVDENCQETPYCRL